MIMYNRILFCITIEQRVNNGTNQLEENKNYCTFVPTVFYRRTLELDETSDFYFYLLSLCEWKAAILHHEFLSHNCTTLE